MNLDLEKKSINSLSIQANIKSCLHVFPQGKGDWSEPEQILSVKGYTRKVICQILKLSLSIIHMLAV